MSDILEVVKYKEVTIGDYLVDEVTLTPLNIARAKLFKNGLIGKLPGQPAHGNISMRLPSDQRNRLLRTYETRLKGYLDEQRGLFDNAFIITATRTGELENLVCSNFVIVLHYDPKTNTAYVVGQEGSSSEVPTHASVYKHAEKLQPNRKIESVAHGHNKSIWSRYAELGLPSTSESIPYGDPRMDEQIESLPVCNQRIFEKRAFVMLGHKNGVVSFGKDPDEAAQRLIDLKTLAEKN